MLSTSFRILVVISISQGIKVLDFNFCKQNIDGLLPINDIEKGSINEIGICFRFSSYKLQEFKLVQLERFTAITLLLDKNIGYISIKDIGYMILWKDIIIPGTCFDSHYYVCKNCLEF